MKAIAVYHNKGGVGKTTTVVNLAAGLARERFRVLVVDLDAQANATLALGVAGRSDEEADAIRKKHVLHLLTKRLTSISEVTRRSRFGEPPVDVVPSHISIHEKEKDLSGLSQGLKAGLYNKLQQESDGWDVVIIDAPPAKNVFAEIALLACDHLLVPSDLKPFAFSGLDTVLNLVAEVNLIREKQIGRRPINILGVLPSKILSNHAFRKHTLPVRVDKVKSIYDVDVLDSIISERIDLAKSFEQEVEEGNEFLPNPKSIFAFNVNSDAAKEFAELTNEIIRRAELTR